MPKTRALTKTEVVLNVFFGNLVYAIVFAGLVPAVLILMFTLTWGLFLALTCVAVSPFIGVVAGLVVAIITFSRHSPLQDAKRYRTMASTVSAIVYAVGGFSTAPIISWFVYKSDYPQVVQQATSIHWVLITLPCHLAYEAIVNGNWYDVSGVVIFGLVGWFMGRYASEWYINASKTGLVPVENEH